MNPSSSSIKSQLLQYQFPTHLYSPRTTFSHHIKEISQLKINMIINIDKYILGNLKNQFEKRNKELNMLEFLHFSNKFLKDWNIQLYGREVKMTECLMELWKEIDVQNKGKITWEEFNSKIIETSLNLKSLSNNAGIQAPNFKEISVAMGPAKYENPIAKLIHISKKNKMAFFRQQSPHIQFFSTQTSKSNQHPTIFKPILLPQQELKVETIMKIKEKSQHQSTMPNNSMQKSSKFQQQKTVKKDVKVSSYKNTVLDAIYIEDPKYQMLIISCSDKYIRGYNVSGNTPVIAQQPQNEDQLMLHQFPVEIYTMAWDSINQVLYATGKSPKIYQWMVKTDSEREMIDPRGHQEMISTLLMLPKLQLLATGGYDGKLILWDAVGQSIKCKYQEHTRAISSITFHEGLILLFTSAYDHKICVWNPYISSLIHKIDNSLNVISVQIIPNTNYLLSVDVGGTVKIRQINRFTQVTTFSIHRSEDNEQAEDFTNNNNMLLGKGDKQNEGNICMGSKKDETIQYYFGTQKIVGYEYFQIEKSSILGGNCQGIKYQKSRFRMYAAVKNHIIVWNLLEGKIDQIFYDMAQNDITSIQIIQDLGFLILGDLDGNIVQRKCSNGFMVKKLHKLKTPINNIKCYQIQKNQKQKSLKKTYLIFSTTQQGQIIVLKCHPKEQFELYKSISLRHEFVQIKNSGNLIGIEYFSQKTLLVVSTSNGDVLCFDVEKKVLLVKIQLGDVPIVGITLVKSDKDKHLNYYLTIIKKDGKLVTFYLPPHSKKFKPASVYHFDLQEKIQTLIYSPLRELYFVSTESNELSSYKLKSKHLDQDNYHFTIESLSSSHPHHNSHFSANNELKHLWKIDVQKKVTRMMLIQNQQIIILLNQSEEFLFVKAETGDLICKLKLDQNKGLQTQNGQIQPETILYFKQQTNQILIPQDQKVIKIFDDELKQKKVQTIINPNFFIDYLKDKNVKNFNKISNPLWTLNLNFNSYVSTRIKEVQQAQLNIKQYLQILQKPGSTEVQKKLQKAVELQKKWEKQRELQNTELGRKQSIQRNSYLQSNRKSSFALLKPSNRVSSLGSLWKHKQNSRKTQMSRYAERTNNEYSLSKKYTQIQKVDLSKLKQDPLFRLGLALKSVNNRDKKAQNFIEMAKKKEELRLPKINTQKIKP